MMAKMAKVAIVAKVAKVAKMAKVDKPTLILGRRSALIFLTSYRTFLEKSRFLLFSRYLSTRSFRSPPPGSSQGGRPASGMGKEGEGEMSGTTPLSACNWTNQRVTRQRHRKEGGEGLDEQEIGERREERGEKREEGGERREERGERRE